jgi:hypothetical protein
MPSGGPEAGLSMMSCTFYNTCNSREKLYTSVAKFAAWLPPGPEAGLTIETTLTRQPENAEEVILLMFAKFWHGFADARRPA